MRNFILLLIAVVVVFLFWLRADMIARLEFNEKRHLKEVLILKERMNGIADSLKKTKANVSDLEFQAQKLRKELGIED